MLSDFVKICELVQKFYHGKAGADITHPDVILSQAHLFVKETSKLVNVL